MKSYWLGLGVIAVLLAFASVANAAEVIVSPENMNGWNFAVRAGWDVVGPLGELLRGGPAATPAGSGAFHFKTFTPAIPPAMPTNLVQSVCLGTNNHTGLLLSSITAFKYYTYVNARDYAYGGAAIDAGGQPPLIELITDSGTTVQQRRFVYRPYGWNAQYHVGIGAWQEWDMMAADGHPHWEMEQSSSTNVWGDWNWLKVRYGDQMRLATPVVGNPIDGYSGLSLKNLTGTSLSIFVGGVQATVKIWNPEISANTNGWRWWREGAGIDAYADKLLIEVNGVQTVYDYEGGRLVGMTNKDAKSGVAGTGVTNLGIKVTLWGKVLAEPAPTASEFFIEDGSGTTVKVAATNAAQVGEQWRAEGSLDSTTTPATLTCAGSDVTKIN